MVKKKTKPSMSQAVKFPPGIYVIRVAGSTLECGVGAITKAQHSFWSKAENEGSIENAVSGRYDYGSKKIPRGARLLEGVRNYADVEDFYGFEEESAIVEIRDSKGEAVFQGTFSELFRAAHQDEDSLSECSEENGEIYPNAFGSGQFLIYKHFGKGFCFQLTLELSDGLDLAKFKVGKYDVGGDRYVNEIIYDEDVLEDEGVDQEYGNWRGTSSEFSVHRAD